MSTSRYSSIFVLVILISVGCTVLANQDYNAATQFHASYQYDEAVKSYTSAIQSKPDYYQAYAGRGITYAAVGQHQLAKDDYDTAVVLFFEDIKFNPEHEITQQFFPESEVMATALWNRSLHNLHTQDFDLANQDLDIFEQVTNQSLPVNFYEQKALALTGKKEYQKALAFLDIAIELFPNNYEPYLVKGQIYSELELPATAIQFFTEGIKLVPSSSDMYFFRGQAYVDIDEYERAIVNLEKSKYLGKKDFEMYFTLGGTYLESGDFYEAENNYDLALKKNPTSWETYLNRSLVYMNTNQQKKGLNDLNKSLELNTSSALAYSNRGAIYQEMGNHVQALQDFDRAINLDSNSAISYLGRALSFSATGQVELAEEDYIKACQLDREYC